MRRAGHVHERGIKRHNWQRCPTLEEVNLEAAAYSPCQYVAPYAITLAIGIEMGVGRSQTVG